MKFNLIDQIRQLFPKRRRQTFQSLPEWPFSLPPFESRDRLPYDQQTILQLALEAWRSNPLARRIVELTSQYVVGGGIRISCGHPMSEQIGRAHV